MASIRDPQRVASETSSCQRAWSEKASAKIIASARSIDSSKWIDLLERGSALVNADVACGAVFGRRPTLPPLFEHSE